MIFHIFQGIGIAAAVGIRPFLPALLVGALAAGNVEIDFKGTGYHFLQTGPFLLVLVVLAILLALAERQIPPERLERPPGVVAVAVLALALGALLFAGALARGHHAAWPGLIGGVICAAVAVVATRPLLGRVRRRLEAPSAAGEFSSAVALPVYAEAAAVLMAVLSVLAPPLGPIALALLVWLVVAGRRRAEQKYAGLRILR